MLSDCNGAVDQSNREQIRHGTTAFPCACYHDDLSRQEVPWHWHDELEAAVITEGAVHVVIGGAQYDLRRGEGFFVNAGVLHSCQALTSDRCRMHSVCFHPRLVGGSAESVFHQSYVLPITENGSFEGLRLDGATPWQAEVLSAFEAAWQACANEPVRYAIAVRHGLSEALAGISEHMASIQKGASPKSLRDGARIKTMLQFIMEHYGDEINTADIARSAAVSESECLRCFRATIGTTPARYLREYRIDRAAGQLAAGGAVIADIAARCGFQDISYFTRTFRELKGDTPGAYQRRHMVS